MRWRFLKSPLQCIVVHTTINCTKIRTHTDVTLRYIRNRITILYVTVHGIFWHLRFIRKRNRLTSAIIFSIIPSRTGSKFCVFIKVFILVWRNLKKPDFKMMGMSFASLKKHPAVSNDFVFLVKCILPKDCVCYQSCITIFFDRSNLWIIFFGFNTNFCYPGLKILKKYIFYVQLIPLYVCTGVGALGAGYYLLRLATRNPDVTWSRVQNPEPNQEYQNKQYKVTITKFSFFHLSNFLFLLLVLLAN